MNTALTQLEQLAMNHNWLSCEYNHNSTDLIVLRHWYDDIYAVHYFSGKNRDYYCGYFASYRACLEEIERRKMLMGILSVA